MGIAIYASLKEDCAVCDKESKEMFLRKSKFFIPLPVIALFCAGGLSSANAIPSAEPEVQVAIEETADGFLFLDSGSEDPLKAKRTTRSGEDEQTLRYSSDKVPVITNVLSALPDMEEHHLDYDESVESAQLYREPEVLPEGEVAYEEKQYTADEVAFDETLLKPRAAFAVTPTGVEFHMNHANSYEPRDFKYYALMRDDVLLDVFTEATFSDEGLSPDSSYKYEIIATDSDPRVLREEGEAIEARSIFINVSTPSPTLERASRSNLVTNATKVYTQAYMHTTFIPGSRVAIDLDGKFGCMAITGKKVEFAGDNRSYEVPTFRAPYALPSYRTMMFVNIGFDNPAGNRVFTVKNVNPTKKYVGGVYEATATASSANMKFEGVSASSSYAQLVINHQSTNPFCWAGSITYHDEVRFYRTSNTMEVVGWRFPVPNHEISMRFDTTAAPGSFWLPAVWRGTQSFSCLSGYCARDNYSKNMKGL